MRISARKTKPVSSAPAVEDAQVAAGAGRQVAAPAGGYVLRAQPHPADVKQSIWHNTCYILASLQTIAARHPAHIASMLTPTRKGIRVRHHGVSSPELVEPKIGPRFTPETQAAGFTRVACATPIASRAWPMILQHAYLAITGHGVRFRGYPDSVLYWALGCRVQTALLPQGAMRATVLATLARMFAEGECVVFFVRDHCWSLIGAESLAANTGANEPHARWRLTLSDPRSWRTTFHAFSDAGSVWRCAHAYAVTLGAAMVVSASYPSVTHYLLDSASRTA